METLPESEKPGYREGSLEYISRMRTGWEKRYDGIAPLKVVWLLEPVLRTGASFLDPSKGDIQCLNTAAEELGKKQPAEILQLAEQSYETALASNPIHAYEVACYFLFGKEYEEKALARNYEVLAKAFSEETDPARKITTAQKLVDFVEHQNPSERDPRLQEAGKVALLEFRRRNNKSAEPTIARALTLLREGIIDVRTDDELFKILHRHARAVIGWDLEHRYRRQNVLERVNEFEQFGLLRLGEDDDLIEKATRR